METQNLIKLPIKYRTPEITGRFGNVLYGLLNNYIYAKNNNENYENYVFVHSKQINFISDEIINAFNLNKIYYKNINNSLSDNEINYIPERKSDKKIVVFSEFGVDFTEEQLNSFIKDVFLKNNCFKKELIKDRVSINIRGGDYLYGTNKKLFKFDFNNFLQISLSHVKNNKLKILDIYSDDFEYAKTFDNIFKKFNFNVNYKIGSNALNDFVNSSLYETKIIWNSTFAYWTAYISNVLFNGTNYKKIFAPKQHVIHRNNGNAWQLNPKWTII